MEIKKENNIDDRIERIVKSYPEGYYASQEELSFLKRYSKCNDFILSNKLIKDIWGWFRGQIINYSVEGDKQLPAPVSLLHTNSGAGKMLEAAPKNTSISAYNLDYVCKRVTEFVCQDRNEKGLFNSFERDISQYFAVCNTNSSRKYNIVITQPDDEMTFYKSIDNNREVGELSALEYYIKRGSHFVNENGFLVVIHSPSNDIPFEKLEKLAGMKIVKQFKDKDLEYLSYEAIVFKNN
tara:strand:+ start:185 stop:898 length:714 start_codon:yes stop_codon:yes gene_type:complete